MLLSILSLRSIFNTGSWQRLSPLSIVGIFSEDPGVELFHFKAPKQFKLFFVTLTVINKLVFMLKQVLILKNPKSFKKILNFSVSEILQNSEKRSILNKKEENTIRQYYELKLSQANQLNFNKFISDTRPIYTRIYNIIKTHREIINQKINVS